MASIIIQFVSSLLLFCLVFGMTATVEVSQMKKQVHNHKALLIGATIQFLVLPFIGGITVLIFQLPAEIGITLLVITSSPGGSYSNWWCSMFNADLALSVTMTALSTILATVMLPINLLIYSRYIYSASVIQSLDWTSLFISLIVVLSGICCGLFVSQYTTNKQHRNGNPSTQPTTNDSTTAANAAATATISIDDMHRNANRMGNIAGLALIVLSVTVSSSHQEARIWDQDISFYAACAIPPMIGLLLAVTLASHFQLDKPERVAVSVESCYQNTGIATTVALTMFQSESELATAIGVPLYYGIVEAILILSFCIICWKCGWTKAPSNENICNVITTSYEVERNHSDGQQQETTTIEVVFGSSCSDQHVSATNSGKGSKYIDMIFSRQFDDGDYIVDDLTLVQQNDLENIRNQKQLHRHRHTMSISDSPTLTDSPTISIGSDEATVNDDSSSSNTTASTIIDQLRRKSRLGTNGEGRKTLSNIRAFATGYRRPLPFLYDEDYDDSNNTTIGSYQHVVPIPERRATPTVDNSNTSIHGNIPSGVTTSTKTTPIMQADFSSGDTLSTAKKSQRGPVSLARRRTQQYETVATNAVTDDDFLSLPVPSDDSDYNNSSNIAVTGIVENNHHLQQSNDCNEKDGIRIHDDADNISL